MSLFQLLLSCILFHYIYFFIICIMKMAENKEIVNFIENNSSKIIENIEFESIATYNFLKEQFTDSNVRENYLFQFVYRSFYRLDNAGLTPEFKNKYFIILEDYRDQEDFNFSDILQRLYVIPNSRGFKTFQFSFTTKMLNIIDEQMPIYDSEVAKTFGFIRPYTPSFDKKLDIYLNKYEVIKDTYLEILNKHLLPKTNICFDEKFKEYKINEIKKLDFIFWSAGKLKMVD